MAQRQSAIRWRKLDSEAAVTQALLTALPPGSSVDAIKEFCADQRLEFSDVFDGMIKASAPARGRRPFVSAKWLITFEVADDSLTGVDVELGLTGP